MIVLVIMMMCPVVVETESLNAGGNYKHDLLLSDYIETSFCYIHLRMLR